jgi:ubiquinol-cytochrome c reductase cytochrome c1 subunit
MTPPLTADGQVEYPDGTKPTIDQMARDVVNFMQWAAEPEMEERKGLGVSALIFTAILTIFFFIAKRIVWRGVR